MSWSDIKFGAEDADEEVRDLIGQAQKLRQAEDPDEENYWMGDIISHLAIAAEELRSAYSKVALL